jgi:hypothetical protein
MFQTRFSDYEVIRGLDGTDVSSLPKPTVAESVGLRSSARARSVLKRTAGCAVSCPVFDSWVVNYFERVECLGSCAAARGPTLTLESRLFLKAAAPGM